MAVTISAITCPQCGSADLEEQDGFWRCHTCGSKIIIEHDQAVLQPERTETAQENAKRIVPTFTKTEFLREIYRQFARDDAPLDIFDVQIGAPDLSERQVLTELVYAQVNYTAGIGYDRQEPYLTTERYYDRELKRHRERYVTKYKTVTDWSTTDGSIQASSIAVTENEAENNIDTALFSQAYLETDKAAFEELSENEQDVLCLSDAALQRLEEEHDDDFYGEVKRRLPGDRSRDIRCTADISDRFLTLYQTPVYTVSFQYRNETYVRYAYPFGKELRIGGNGIKGASAEKAETVWTRTKLWTIFAALFLVASIILSFALRTVAGVVVSFVVAFAFFIAQEIIVHIKAKNTDKDYAERKQKALQKKLQALDEDRG